jgi:hypothetical protein
MFHAIVDKMEKSSLWAFDKWGIIVPALEMFVDTASPVIDAYLKTGIRPIEKHSSSHDSEKIAIFLDHLVRKNNQDDHGNDNPLPSPGRNAVKDGTIAENVKAVQRAELVQGTENARHKVKVIHSKTPSSRVRPKSDGGR